MRVLMNKQRSERSDVTKSFILKNNSLPTAQGFDRQGMARRSQAEKIHHHQLTVAIPAVRQEADFGSPSVRQQRGIFREPCPFDAIENIASQASDFGMPEMRATRQNTAKEYRRVNRRDFRIPDPLTGFHVGKVIEESPVIGHFLPE